MELIALIFMLGFGGAIAVFVLAAITISKREDERAGVPPEPPRRDSIAASLLFHVIAAGGVADDEALRRLRRNAGLGAPVTRGIDVTSWAEAFARHATPEQRESLLETAVRLIATSERAVPLRQYNALLDLSFALGFQTNALAKLREQYGFTYVDHAKDARPREADRVGGAAPLFVRESTDTAPLLRLLELDGAPSRQAIVSAYRRLAAQHHPDRFHGRSAGEQTEAAARFIEITRAYETLLTMYRD